MVRGAHGQEKADMEEILRVRCWKCGNRVVIEVGEDEAKCPSCGAKVTRPRKSGR